MKLEHPRTLTPLLCLAAAVAAALSPGTVAQQPRVQAGATNIVAATNAVRVNTAPAWRAKARRAHETEWQAVTLITNPVSRRVRAVTNSYVELAGGLNYREPGTARWRPSDPAFRLTARGAEATNGAHTVRLAPDIATFGSVTVRKGNVTMQSHPLCVGYYDPVDGRSVRLAEITNAVGWLVSSNEVVYSNCFNGLRASILIRNSRAGIEQDLLLHEQPEFRPADFGFSRQARLELFTEFVGDTPLPDAVPRVLGAEASPAGTPPPHEREFKDHVLTFGPLRMNPGRAFTTGARGPQDRARADAVPVGKRFEIIEGRKILIEAVPVRHIERALDALPAATLPGVVTNAAAALREPTAQAALPPERRASLGQKPPPIEPSDARRSAGRGREAQLAAIFQPRADEPIRSLPVKQLALHARPESKIQTAALPSDSGRARLLPSRDPTIPGRASLPASRDPTIPGRASLPASRDQTAAVGSAGASPYQPPSSDSSTNSDLVLVIDYQLLGAYSQHNHTFYADTTYLCSGQVDLTGTTTFEGGTVIKYVESVEGEYGPEPVYALLHVMGPIDCKTDAYRPAIFTSVYDNSVGETIDTSRPPGRFHQAIAFNNVWDGGPYGYPPPAGGTPRLRQLKHIEVRHADYALHSGWVDVDLRHARFDHCTTVFYPEWGRWNVGNILVHDATTVFSGAEYGLFATNVTVNGCAQLITTWGDPFACTAEFHNHLLADVTSFGLLEDPENEVDRSNLTPADLLSSAGLFQSAGGGHHYLADGSPHRDTAPTAVTQPDLLADLRQMTTHPPTVLSGELSLPTTLAKVVPRDHDTALDRGYHYPAVDWLATGLNVTAGPLKVTGGAVIAIGYTDTMNYGFQLSGVRLHSEGTPLAMNRFVPSVAVQESGLTAGPYYFPGMIGDAPVGATMPQTCFRFTEFTGLGGATHITRWGIYSESFEISHSRLMAVRFYETYYGNAGRTAGFTNNLFHRGVFDLYSSQPLYVGIYNNLFLKNRVILHGGDIDYWSVHDNIFDACNLSNNGSPVVNSHNAYVYTTPLSGGNNNQTPASIGYVSGPLGDYYLPAGSTLINTGSRPAAAAGLYHFTTLASQLKEGADPGAPPNYKVDIGLHYVALGGSGLVSDADGDGWPDYLEDSNGNGNPSPDPGETGWQTYNSPGGLSGLTGLVIFSPLEN